MTNALGASDLAAVDAAYGCMRIAGTWNPAEITEVGRQAAFDALEAAYNAGYTLFDHADIYCRGECEALHGDFLKAHPSLRAETVIATKGGIRRRDDPPGAVGRYDFSAAYLIGQCEASLAKLGMERIDLYQLHRPDALMDPHVVAEAFDNLARRGLVRWFGVSNFYPSQFAMLQKWLPMPLVVNQIEVHLGRIAPLVDGTLDQCLERGITPLSWSPLGGGWLGRIGATEDLAKDRILAALDRIGPEYGLDRAGLAIAWLRKHPSGIIPIVGSCNPARIASGMAASRVDISREHWYELYVASRGEPMP